MTPDEPLCLRQGYGGCTCTQCLVWVNRWDKELKTFATIDNMTRDGNSLFQIYEYLRAQHPDILRMHHRYIQEQYIAHTTVTTKPRIKLKTLQCSPLRSPHPSPPQHSLDSGSEDSS